MNTDTAPASSTPAPSGVDPAALVDGMFGTLVSEGSTRAHSPRSGDPAPVVDGRDALFAPEREGGRQGNATPILALPDEDFIPRDATPGEDAAPSPALSHEMDEALSVTGADGAEQDTAPAETAPEAGATLANDRVQPSLSLAEAPLPAIHASEPSVPAHMSATGPPPHSPTFGQMPMPARPTASPTPSYTPLSLGPIQEAEGSGPGAGNALSHPDYIEQIFQRVEAESARRAHAEERREARSASVSANPSRRGSLSLAIVPTLASIPDAPAAVASAAGRRRGGSVSVSRFGAVEGSTPEGSVPPTPSKLSALALQNPLYQQCAAASSTHTLSSTHSHSHLASPVSPIEQTSSAAASSAAFASLAPSHAPSADGHDAAGGEQEDYTEDETGVTQITTIPARPRTLTKALGGPIARRLSRARSRGALAMGGFGAGGGPGGAIGGAIGVSVQSAVAVVEVRSGSSARDGEGEGEERHGSTAEVTATAARPLKKARSWGALFAVAVSGAGKGGKEVKSAGSGKEQGVHASARKEKGKGWRAFAVRFGLRKARTPTPAPEVGV